MLEKLYTTRELASHLKLKVSTILGYVKKGRISPLPYGKEYMFSESEIKRFLTITYEDK